MFRSPNFIFYLAYISQNNMKITKIFLQFAELTDFSSYYKNKDFITKGEPCELRPRCRKTFIDKDGQGTSGWVRDNTQSSVGSGGFLRQCSVYWRSVESRGV